MKPLTRRETYLNAIANGETNVPDPITREETYLHQIAMNGGSGGLPEVSAADNGDVLTVVEGEWNKAAPSGGGGLIEIGVTVDEQTGAFTLQKTGQEILDYISAGLIPYVDFVYTYEEVSHPFTNLFFGYDAEAAPTGTMYHAFHFGFNLLFICTNLSGYPTATD